MTKIDAQKLRSQVGDRTAMETLYATDTDFRATVDKYRAVMKNMSPIAEAKFPTAMLNRHYDGKFSTSKSVSPQTTDMANIAAALARQKQETPSFPLPGMGQEGSSEPSLMGFAGNVVKSGVNFAQDLGSAVMHPIETAKNVGKLAIGAAANTVETVVGDENLFNAPGEDMATKVGQFYVDRYGSIEAAKKTMYEDPIGFLADAASVLSLGGGALRAGVGVATKGAESVRLGSTAAKIGKLGTKAIETANAIDPAMALTRAAGSAIRTVAEAPVKIAGKQISSAFKLTPTDARAINEMAGVPYEQWLLKNKVIKPGSTSESIMSRLEQLWQGSKDKVDTGLGKIRELYDINARKGQYAARPVGDALDVLIDTFDGVPGNEDIVTKLQGYKQKRMLTLSEINEVKGIIDRERNVFDRMGDVKAGATNRGLKNIRMDVQKLIENNAARNGFKDVKELNKRTQIAYEIRDAMQKTDLTKGKNNVVRLTDYLAGGVGSVVGGPGGMLAGFGLSRVAGSQRFKTALASVLSTLSPDTLSRIEQAILGGVITDDIAPILQDIFQRVKAQIPEQLEQPIVESTILPERTE